MSKQANSSDTQPITEPIKKAAPLWRVLMWNIIGMLVGLVIILALAYYGTLFGPNIGGDTTEQLAAFTPTHTATPPVTPQEPSAAQAVTEGGSTPTAAAFQSPTPTITPLPDVTVLEISPKAADIGWVTSEEEQGHHFGDSYLYAGIFEGQVYNGAFQFDLSSVPRGAPIYSASIQLTGLREDRLAKNNDLSRQGGAWTLKVLDAEADRNWRAKNFQEIFNAPVLHSLTPILGDENLAANKTNTFQLSEPLVKVLEQRIIDNENPTLSFKVDGPIVGSDNLFAWDTGHGSQSNGSDVILRLEVGQPPATPPPFAFVIVTSTPTPENVVTAAAVVVQMTADAQTIGTATPVPPNMVTATPYPAELVVTATPLPENQATVQAIAAEATAIALTTGTPRSLPTNAVTATPTATPTETPTPLPTPIPTYILITSTPTPETIFAAATQAAEGTAQAKRYGTPTPLPTNWVTPIVVTETPTPANQATAQALAMVATAQAFTTGTPTPTPSNMVTATATPVFNAIPYLFTPTPTATSTPSRDSMPPELIGKVLFLSDRERASSSEPAEAQPADATQIVYVYDPQTGELGRLTDDWPYRMAQERNSYSADEIFRVYIKQLLWTNIEEDNGDGTTSRTPTEELALHTYDYKYDVEKIVHRFGAGIVYDPVWSPTSNQIAFVATESGNDEIWVINSDGTLPRQLTRNTWEWDKSPSWSPDGSKIVFMSNRTGNQQLWVMNADGSDQRLLMGWDNWNHYNDYAPVWVTYSDLPPTPDQGR